jgi:alpha-mannosidase
LDLHVVPHTHWDREWYHPAERFRQRLVALVDELIDDPPRDDESFLLDGQTIVIDDYLAVRPDRAATLHALLRTGRLEAGPWFVLADELIPGGEALVRNLLAGRRTLRRIGVEPPPVLYCPDSFGHPAALPSIAAGFGLPLIILWRGFGGARWPATDVVRWVSANREETVVYHLPRDGYEFGSHLPLDAAGAAARWQRIRAELAPRSAIGVELLPNGADHHARQPGFGDAVALLASAASPDRVHASSMRAFAERLVGETRARSDELPVVRGELRDSYGYTWTLQGTFATRAHEKRLNARAERLLLREAEPWAALAGRAGPSARAFVDAAWRSLLEAHPHDTLCGCSIDDVADAMELRIRSATNQAIGVRDDSIARLIGHDAVEARTSPERWRPIVLVRNAAARPRGGVAIVDDETFLADVPVGPGSAASPGLAPAPERHAVASLDDAQVLNTEVTHSLTESPRHYPDNDLVNRRRVAVWVAPIPAYGVAVPGASAARPSREVTAGDSTIENAHCRLIVDESGAVTLEDVVSGRRITQLIQLIDEADVGDTYTPAPRPTTYSIELVGRDAGHRGPLIGDLSLRYRLREAAGQTSGRVTDIAIRLVLEADAPWVRIEVEGENRLEDHRLRLRIAGDVRGGAVWADAAVGPVQRVPIVVPAQDAASELPPRTAPLHRYVSRFDVERGCSVVSDGLAEYEATDDGAILITLVRAVGRLSAADLPERPGHAGWPKLTPGAQCLRPFGASLAFMMHGPRTAETIDAVERAADDVLLPLRGATLRSALRTPDTVRGVELQGIGLALSTIKESEDGRWLVLRCVNLLEETVAGSWSVPFDVMECVRARLDETVMQGLSSIERAIAFDAGPREIVTILVR